MKIESLRRMLEDRGYQVFGEVACGIEDGYPVAVQFRRFDVCIAFTVADDCPKAVCRELGRWARLSGGRLTFHCFVWENGEPFEGAVRSAVECLRRHSIQRGDTCSVCGLGDCDTLVYAEGQFCLLHDVCCEKLLRSIDSLPPPERGSIVSGLPGGLLGGLVGLVPALAGILLFGKLYGVLFALIPAAIQTGYRLGHGRMACGVPVVTALASVLTVFVMELTLIVASFCSYYGFSLSEALEMVGASLKAWNTWVLMTQNAIYPLLFSILGNWIFWRCLPKNDQTLFESLQQHMDTRTSI